MVGGDELGLQIDIELSSKSCLSFLLLWAHRWVWSAVGWVVGGTWFSCWGCCQHGWLPGWLPPCLCRQLGIVLSWLCIGTQSGPCFCQSGDIAIKGFWSEGKNSCHWNEGHLFHCKKSWTRERGRRKTPEVEPSVNLSRVEKESMKCWEKEVQVATWVK